MSTPLDSPDQGGVATLDRELEELLREENLEPGDHERFSHYAVSYTHLTLPTKA